MNLPNKLTISRFVMAPLFFISFNMPYWIDSFPPLLSALLVCILYAATELTDLLDGLIARKYHLVTDLGKVMDPFADTFSRLTYFVCFTTVGIMPAWTFLIIMYREFTIVFLRMLMMGKGKAVAANIWGKTKAVLYAISGLAGISYTVANHLLESHAWHQWANPALYVLFVVTAIASVVSFSTYVYAIIREGALSHMSR